MQEKPNNPKVGAFKNKKLSDSTSMPRLAPSYFMKRSAPNANAVGENKKQVSVCIYSKKIIIIKEKKIKTDD